MVTLVPHIKYRTEVFNLTKFLSTLPFTPIFSEYRKWAVDKGFKFAPVGNSNRKTDVPNTYRPVGETCPKNCKFHPEHYVDKQKLSGTCYAWSGHVRMQWSRFNRKRQYSQILIEEINAAVLAMTYRQITREYLRESNTTGARLHVSGDFIKKENLDLQYIKSLYYAAFLLGQRFPNTKEFAYTYTAIPKDIFEPYRIALREVGIYVIYSQMSTQDLGGGQSIVWEHNKIKELEDLVPPDTKVIPCLYQTHDNMTCRRCGLCGYKNNDKLLIVFDPHGHNRKSIAKVISSAELKDDGSGKLKLFFE